MAWTLLPQRLCRPHSIASLLRRPRLPTLPGTEHHSAHRAARQRRDPAAGDRHTVDRNGGEPDIHVHIGRVEIAAVRAPARTAREPRSEPKRLSLSEYLQRPRRGAR
jgi:hypothetical protein